MFRTETVDTYVYGQTLKKKLTARQKWPTIVVFLDVFHRLADCSRGSDIFARCDISYNRVKVWFVLW